LQCDRRSFLIAAGGLGAGLLTRSARSADGRPPATAPRATSGDRVAEPDWEERLTVTVGPQNAQLVGNDDKVLQAAVDWQGELKSITIRGNDIRETRGPGERVGIQIGKQIKDLRLEGNQIQGFSTQVSDNRE
jgi:hypothetical protein